MRLTYPHDGFRHCNRSPRPTLDTLFKPEKHVGHLIALFAFFAPWINETGLLCTCGTADTGRICGLFIDCTRVAPFFCPHFPQATISPLNYIYLDIAAFAIRSIHHLYCSNLFLCSQSTNHNALVWAENLLNL